MKLFSKTSGFTLVEVLIGIVVTTVGILGLLTVIVSTMQIDQLTTDMNLATNAARAQMELIHDMSYDDITSIYSDPSKDDFTVPGLSAISGDEDGLPGQIITDNSSGTYVDVRVFVEWNTHGETYNSSLEIRVYKNE